MLEYVIILHNMPARDAACTITDQMIRLNNFEAPQVSNGKAYYDIGSGGVLFGAKG